uniref:PROP1-like PPR domain-containing protein n=1 Tax=Leersia perrieri TaxID=77586 RepID=A0A0D9WF67_9ORYZ
MAISCCPSPRCHLSNPNPTPNPGRRPRPAPTSETLRRRLLRKGVSPTPKILHALRKKEAHKSLRRARKDTAAAAASNALLPKEEEEGALAAEEEARFLAAAAEYRALMGRPWRGGGGGGGALAPTRGALEGEGLDGLREMLAARRADKFEWLLDDDVEEEEAVVGRRGRVGAGWDSDFREEERRIESLVRRLNEDDLSMRDWRLTRLMKKADLIYNEDNLLQILEGLEARGNWRQALSVTEWVYNENIYKHRKSRFVYTKLLSILGKSWRPTEALRVFNIMRADAQIYPDMAAYHSIAVTLGRAGLLNELIKIIEYMKQKPPKRVMKMRRRDWDPSLEPDVLIYNSVLNACVLSQQWKGVFWVFQQMRRNSLTPTGATFGLAMEVMLKAKKYDFVQKFFEKMQKSGVPPRAITYKVLVRSYWEQGKVNEAVEAVKDMEQRGVVGAASVYYELACCLCNKGRWRDALLQVEKLKQLPLTKPLEFTFTGMILASFDGGYILECISIFESMKGCCTPNIGTINVMIKVYGRCDMFGKARDLFETIKVNLPSSNHSSHKADAYTYSSMLETAASAQQWEYFENVYREMTLSHHHLDQNKYSWMLIKASKAGKLYLLEHALDSILERGETPNVQLFCEMICQNIAQSNHAKTLHLLNIMNEASSDVSELQWSKLLEQNMHRFSVNALKDLLKYLSTSDIVKSGSALSFVRALQSQCGTTFVKDTSFLADGTCTGQSQLSLTENITKSSNGNPDQLPGMNSMNTNVFPDENVSSEFSDYIRDTQQFGANAGLSMDIVIGSHFGSKQKEQHDLGHLGTGVSAVDEVLDSMNLYSDGSYGEMLSASEILELWEQERINDMFSAKKAEPLCEDSCTPNSYTYNCLLDALAKAGRADDAQARLQEMVARCGDESVDKYTLTSLLRCYCNAGRPDDANEVFQRMSDRGWVDEYVLTTLAVAFSKWGKVDGAVELVVRMEALGMRLSEKTLSVLVHGFTKQGRVDKAMDMFAKMTSYGFVVDLAMYSVLIEGLCQRKDIEKAVTLFEEMKSSGVAPDARLLKKMVEAFCTEGNFTIVGPFINENAEYLKSGSVVTVYNVVLEGLVCRGEVEAAYHLLHSMLCGGHGVNHDVAVGAHMLHITDDAKPNSDSFNIVVCGLCKDKKLDMALALTKDMISLGCKGKILMFNDLIHELCIIDRLEEGFGIFNQMKDLGLIPSEFTYNSLFYGICRRKDPKAALDLLEEMRKNGHSPWIKNCTEMVQQLCSSGRITEALQFLDGMLQIGFLPDIVTYSAALNGMCKTGEVNSAVGLFRGISCKYYLPDVVAHNIMINGFRKSSRLDEAQKVMEEMLDKGLFPSVVTYNLMIDVCCKTGMIEKAIGYLDKMVAEERRPTVITYTSLIDGFCSAGRPDEAIKLWREMSEKGCAPNDIAYIAFVNGLCKCGRIEIALTYFEEMLTKGFELDTFSLLYFINFLISNGHSTKGCELLNEVLQKDTYGNNLKMVGLINKAVVELSKDGRTSSYILKFLEKASIYWCQPCGAQSCILFIPSVYISICFMQLLSSSITLMSTLWCQQWKGVFWVFQQMRRNSLIPTGATFGFAMEVMLKAKKYDFVQKFFEKMQKSGELIARAQQKQKLQDRKRTRDQLEEMKSTAQPVYEGIDPRLMKQLGITKEVEYMVSPVFSRDSVRRRGGGILQKLGHYLKP